MKKAPIQPASPMTMVMLSQESWDELNNRIAELAKLVTNRNEDDRKAQWIESEEARKMLGVSIKTWQNYRNQRVIGFSQIGRKIYVNRGELEEFMRTHYIAPRTR